MRLPAAAALVLLLAGAASAGGPADPEAEIQRMSDLVASTLPLGVALEAVAAQDPSWPFQDAPDAVTPEQLACVRGAMGEAGLRPVVVERVRAYAARDPGRIARDIETLDGGGGRLFSRVMIAGMSTQADGIDSPSADELFAEADPQDFAAMYQLLSDPLHRPLRELLGFPGELDMSDGHAGGMAMATTFMMPMMMNAFSTCGVPMSVLKGLGGSAGGPGHGTSGH